MNTKNITDREERKEAKRKARAEAPPIGKRPSDVDRGSQKKKVRTASKGKSRR
jgi:hypothetical protein